MRIQFKTALSILTAGLTLTVYGDEGGSKSSTKVHRVYAGSVENTIELSVFNSDVQASPEVRVSPEALPSWVRITPPERTLRFDSRDGSSVAVFTYDVNRDAPIGQTDEVTFVVSSTTGETWSRTLKITVVPPSDFTLYQNYPNPFNPLTTIPYMLPAESHVVVKILNILGQEIETIVDGLRPAGYHEETWDALGYPSGTYYYQVRATNALRPAETHSKRLIIVK